MGRKNVNNTYVTPTQAIPFNSPTNPSTTVSLSSAFNTLSTNILRQDTVSYQIDINTSDSTGIFYLQCSSNNVTFVDIGVAATVSAVNDTAIVWVNEEFCSAYVRLRYAPTVAGTGSCSIILTSKDIGA